MEQFTQPVEGRHDGEEAAATLGGLHILGWDAVCPYLLSE